MDSNKLIKVSSITKKLVVALFGAFLLLFLLFHMCANLCVLRNDEGAWYSAFCHFMGTNIFVKIFEVVLLACFALHIVLALWLQVENKKARPVGYQKPSKTRTAKGSKLMMLTGILILAFLVMHFCQFYFVKIGWIEGQYMVQQDDLNVAVMDLQRQMESGDVVFEDETDLNQLQSVFQEFYEGGQMTTDMKWVKQINPEQKRILKSVLPELDVEPDFYYMARNLFKNPVMVLLYLIAFVVLWLHMRHAFESAFQTLGLNNYKYNRAIEIVGVVYSWVVCLGFAAVPLCVFFFF